MVKKASNLVYGKNNIKNNSKYRIVIKRRKIMGMFCYQCQETAGEGAVQR